MKKVVAIAFSDLHYHNWVQHSKDGRRLRLGEEVLQEVSTLCHRYGVPALFTGDWYHTDQAIQNKTLNHSIRAIREHFEYTKIPLWVISGNHDQSERNNAENRSPSYLTVFDMVFSTVTCIDYGYIEDRQILVCGIPYNNGNVDFPKYITKFAKLKTKKMKILLLHADLPGAKEPSGYEGEDFENITTYSEMFSKFDLVLCGHIHKHQQLHDNVVMVGAPYHQRRSDMGCPMGICKVFNDGSTEFVDLELPEYKYIPVRSKKPPNDFHYWVPLEEAEEYQVEEGELREFTPSTTPLKLGKEYIKVNNIKNKQQINALKHVLR